MRVTDEKGSKQHFKSIVHDNNKRPQILKAFMRLLLEMGYKDTVAQIQAQSKVQCSKDTSKTIHHLLLNLQYAKISQEIEHFDMPIPKKLKVYEALQFLAIAQLIKGGKLQIAITKIQQSQFSQQQKVLLYQVIAIGNEEEIREYMQLKERYILISCINCERVVDRVYNKLKDYVYEQSYFPKEVIYTNPPTLLVAESSKVEFGTTKINFIQFNQQANKIAILSNSNKESYLTIWQIKDNPKKNIRQCTVETIARIKSGSINEINCLRWKQIQKIQQNKLKEQLILLCSYDKIKIYNLQQGQNGTFHIVQMYQLSRFSKGIVNSILHAEWQLNSQIVYFGGIFQNIHAINVDTNEIHYNLIPINNTRQIVFTQGHLFAISATKSELIQYSMKKKLQENSFSHKACFMDLKYSNNKIIVSDSVSVIILDSNTLKPIFTFDSPENPQHYKIQVFFYKSWFLIYNEKLTGVFKNENMLKYKKFGDCEAVDVRMHRMATFSNGGLKVWQSQRSNEDDSIQITEQQVQSEVNEQQFYEIQQHSNNQFQADQQQFQFQYRLNEQIENEPVEMDIEYIDSDDSDSQSPL